MCLSLAVVTFLKRQGWLRPVEAPLLSWEAVLFQLVRWPWAVYGSFMGVLVVIRQRNVVFRVTPKGATHPVSLRWGVLFPYIVVVVLSFFPALLVGDAGEASGYYFFLILSQVLYVLALFCIVLIHRHEITQFPR